MNIYAKVIFAAACASLLAGCAVAPVLGAVGSAGNAALSLAGLIDTPPKPPEPKKVQLNVTAGEYLNSDKTGRGFAVVMRVYALRSPDQFTQLPRNAFDTGTPLPEALKPDVLASKEQILVPGQKYALTETFPPETTSLGVVVFFQSADPARWRLALPMETVAADKPILLGVHRCSFTVTDGLKDKNLQSQLSVVGSSACS